MKTKLHILQRLLLALLMLAILGLEALQAQSGIYVGGHFRRERNHTINDLKASGFTYVILFNVNVEPNGDLKTDGELIVSNGTYVFGNTQPNYVNDVNSLKTGVTSINRVEYCIGGWGNTSYDNIRNLVNSQGTGTNSILYRNFRALKLAIPSVDAINNDDEHTYDANTASTFHVMLADVGFKTTIAPYMNRPYWQSLVTNVNNQRAGALDKIYLQTYEGGAGLNACDWRLNNIEMHTGDLYYENSTTVVNKMVHNKNNCGARGGFIWVYNDNNINLKEQAKRINDIYGIRTKNMNEVANFFNDCDYKGFANGLEAGDYNLTRLQSLGITNDVISSLTVLEGFEVVLYDGANFDGASQVISGNNTCLVGAGWNDRAASLKIRSRGALNLDGEYLLQNRQSGLYMDVSGGTAAVGNEANIQQWTLVGTGGSNQKFVFSHVGDGTYKILAKHSGKSIDVAGANKNNGANVQQYTYLNTLNQQFVLVPTTDGFYKILAKHTGKMVEVAGASMQGGANVQQWDNNNQACGQWKLVPVQVITGNGDGLSGNYFNGQNFETPVYSTKDATINFSWGSGTPNASVNPEGFSARWTGQVQPKYSGVYTFYVNSDNGRRLWINNQLIIDKWVDDWGVEYSGTITLNAGQKYDIKLEYFENNGGAECKLLWSSGSQIKEIIPQSQLYSNPLPSVSISSPINSAAFNAPASITINATASDNGSVSKVDFYNGNTFLGSDNSSPYSFGWNNVGEGTYALSARAYDNHGGVTKSAVITVKVNAVVNLLPTISITSPVNNANFNTPASITINANATDTDGTISKVEFFNGSTLIGSDVSSPYSFVWNNVAAGTYTLTAKATDNSNAVTTSSAVTVVVKSVVVNQAPSVSLTSLANNTSLNAPASITINANAADTDGTISKVEFFNGSTLIGSDLSSPYSFVWNNIAAGTYTITAKATDNANAVTTSTAATVVVKTVVVNQAPTVSLTSPVNNASFNAPASVTINANAADADGTVSKVEFFNGSTPIGSDVSSPYSFAWNNVAAGTYTITAKATDNSNAVTTSASVTITVKTVSTNTCTGVAQYTENAGYVAGSKVQNAGSSYQCKPYPFTGWCNGASWAYAPGTGLYWSDAWTLIGPCTATTASTVSTSSPALGPNPATDIITLNVFESSKVTIYNTMGYPVMSQVIVSANGSINISSLPAGLYQIKIETGSEIITQQLIKN